ncbi:MAG: hypothetical protein ABIN08_02415 [Caldimonas sp.]
MTVKDKFELWLYPELGRVRVPARAQALREATKAPFDLFELIGLAFALAMVVSITRYSSLGFGMAQRFGEIFANFVFAIPLLLLLGAPFYIRHTRRGLRKFIEDHPYDRDSNHDSPP